jgi:rhodanese-related sulfurtransferase
MTTPQIILYGFLAFLIFIYVRKFLLTRSVTRYSPSQLADRIKEGGVVLLDVRTTGEFQSGHIKGAIHIPVQELAARADDLKRHGDREIVCYCQSGSRSLMGAARLKKLGYRTASLEGGIAEWNFLYR